jgi:hypothetical protein
VSHIQSGQSHGLDICATHLAPGFVRLHGELSDEADDVTLVRRDSSPVIPVVGENAWAVELPVAPADELPDTLEFRSGETRRRVALSIPADVDEGRCVDPDTARKRFADAKRLRAED